MAEDDIVVHRFNMDLITRKPACCMLCGMRGSGKSQLLKDILYRLHRAGIPRACVFSATEDSNCFFGDFIPPVFIHCKFDIEKLTQIYESQTDLTMKMKVGQVPPDTDPRIVLVLDDMAFDRKLMRSTILREIFFNSRHVHIYFFVTSQYICDVPVAMRSNVDVAFFMAESGTLNRERIYKQACNFYPDFATFNKAFSACTDNYSSFAVHCSAKSSEPQKKGFHYKADISLQFKFGLPSTWKFNTKRYEPPVEKYLRLQDEAKRRKEGSHHTGGALVISKKKK